MSSYPKRLIEVDLPIARISAHARREKSIRHGHISTLHIWWARRPLAACRAVICAALWPDPADPLCPTMFRENAIEAIQAFAARVFPPRVTEEEQTLKRTASVESLGRWEAIAAGTLTLNANQPADLPLLRLALLDFIADFANWDNSTVPAYLETSRALTQAAHEALGGEPGTRPLVVDPFAGGGSIPLEALRVGADAFASDLNPVAVLLNKVVLEYIPKYGNAEIKMKDADGSDVTFHGLADAVRYWGNWVKEQAEKELAEFYPKDRDGSTPIAYLWARTILSDAPGEGQIPIEIPLIRSFWLCNKPNRKIALRWARDMEGHVKTETVETKWYSGKTIKIKRPLIEIFQPRNDKDVDSKTTSGGTATCPVTGHTMSVENVRRQLSERAGGTTDSRLVCVVTTRSDQQGRSYRLPTSDDVRASRGACDRLHSKEKNHRGSHSLVPDEQLNHLRGFFNVVLYGMDRWGQLFSPRQCLALCTLIDKIREAGEAIDSRDTGVANAVETCLALALGKQADSNSTLCAWRATTQDIGHTFGRQALPMMWDYAEPNIFSGATRDWMSAVEGGLQTITSIDSRMAGGHAVQSSALHHVLPDSSAQVAFTDPPYYAAVPYADLSDYFYTWLKRCIGHRHTDLFGLPLTPKDDECVSLSHRAAMYRQKDGAWFENMMGKACAETCRVTRHDGIGVFVFASKETAAWEAMLNALVDAGWTVTASWAIDTEMGSRLRAANSAVLASSIHIVARPRRSADVGEWRDILTWLPRRIHEWMPRLTAEGVVGADAIFACLGPALEIFSRYTHVEKSNGETATLREYLEFVWAAVSTEALSLLFREADAAGLEPDARLTAMWLWTVGGGGMTNGKPIVVKAGVVNVGVEVGTESGATRPRPGRGDPLAGAEEEGEEEEAESDEEQAAPSTKGKAASGFTLEFDAASKISRGLGVHLEQCESLVEIKGDKARLLSVAERTAYLFGKGTQVASGARRKKVSQKSLFEALDDAEGGETGWGEIQGPAPGNTVLDRVHQAMVLFAANRGELLKRFLVADGVGKDPRFWKLADNLNKLYPAGTDERRWVEGVLARKKGLGL